MSTFSVKTWSRWLICPFAPIWRSFMLTGRRDPQTQVFVSLRLPGTIIPPREWQFLWQIKPSSFVHLLSCWDLSCDCKIYKTSLCLRWKATSLHLLGVLIQARLGTVNREPTILSVIPTQIQMSLEMELVCSGKNSEISPSSLFLPWWLRSVLLVNDLPHDQHALSWDLTLGTPILSRWK